MIMPQLQEPVVWPPLQKQQAPIDCRLHLQHHQQELFPDYQPFFLV